MLYDKNGVQIPDRPSGLNDELWKRAITDVVSKSFSGDRDLVEDPDNMEWFINDLAKNSGYYDDSYEIARSMEYTVWHVDFEFLCKIDRIKNLARAKIRDYEKEWAEKYKPVPKFSVNDKCVYDEEIGVITGLSDTWASYEFKVGESTYLIKYEDRSISLCDE